MQAFTDFADALKRLVDAASGELPPRTICKLLEDRIAVVRERAEAAEDDEPPSAEHGCRP